MQITVTFDSLEEFQAHIINPGPSMDLLAAARETVANLKTEKPTPDIKEIVDGPADAPDLAPGFEPVPEDEPTPFDTQPEVSLADVRKALARLNRKTGENLAKKLLKDFGYEKLTDAPAEQLPALYAKAQEALA